MPLQLDEDKVEAIDDITAKLDAAHIVSRLTLIRKAQHEIGVCLLGRSRKRVLAYLRELGVSEETATAYMGELLPYSTVEKLDDLLATVNLWRHDLKMRIRAIAVAEDKT